MKVKIFDSQFGHVATCNDMPSKHIEWYRGDDNTDTCFFTGSSFSLARNIICKTKVGWLIEPRGINPSIYTHQFINDFNYLLTFDREFIKLNPEKILFYPFGCCWINEIDRGIHPKSKMVSMICSGKAYSDGHRFRNRIYDAYLNRFDGYGRYKNPIANKIIALKDYMFSICVQNTKTDDYFTEIIMDCFMTGTIPIFWGTNNIGDYFNAKGIIQFNSEAELNEILNSLSEKLYISKIEHAKENFLLAQKYFSPEDYIYKNYEYIF
jgi:hypothetical protein